MYYSVLLYFLPLHSQSIIVKGHLGALLWLRKHPPPFSLSPLPRSLSLSVSVKWPVVVWRCCVQERRSTTTHNRSREKSIIYHTSSSFVVVELEWSMPANVNVCERAREGGQQAECHFLCLQLRSRQASAFREAPTDYIADYNNNNTQELFLLKFTLRVVLHSKQIKAERTKLIHF